MKGLMLIYEHCNMKVEEQRELEALLVAKSGLTFDGCQPPISEQHRCFNKVWLSAEAKGRLTSATCARGAGATGATDSYYK